MQYSGVKLKEQILHFQIETLKYVKIRCANTVGGINYPSLLLGIIRQRDMRSYICGLGLKQNSNFWRRKHIRV
jgi:hypothetical protein